MHVMSGISRKSLFYSVALIILIVIITVILLSSPDYSPSSVSGPRVFVDLNSGGSLEGVLLKRENGLVSAFYGIPFAKPPVASRRFKRPVPFPGFKSDETFNARTLPYGCPANQPWAPVPESEDCLYLNIFVPGADIDVTKKKKVMVWIYGGSFVMGSNRADNSEMASFGDVIVVSIAYRVGIFGWLQSTSKLFDSNVGLHDQALALKWVYDNIDSFGGDKEEITIFGESAGSISVGFHLMSNYSRPYFKRAIMESGAPSPLTFLGTNNDPIKVRDLIVVTDCDTKRTEEEVLSCLQKTPLATLKSAQEKLMKLKNTAAIIPVPDGDFVPKNPFQFFQESNAFATHHKEILIGINGEEGAMFTSSMFPDLFPPTQGVNPDLTWDVLSRNLQRKFQPKNMSEIDGLISLMEEPGDTPQKIAIKFSQVVGQMIFGCASFNLATNFVKSPERKLYFYQFDVRPDNSKIYPWAEKAIHTDEVPFVFGSPFLPDKKKTFTNEERRLSKTIMTYWSNFAKTGKPDTGIWIPSQNKTMNYLWIKDLKTFEVNNGLPTNICDRLLSR